MIVVPAGLFHIQTHVRNSRIVICTRYIVKALYLSSHTAVLDRTY